MNQPTPSPESQLDAMKIARATQKPGQTKEQTKLIAQGIEKGIAQYKKQQKAKARERDKERKKVLKKKSAPQAQSPAVENVENVQHLGNTKLPWTLLALSWIGFGLYLALN